MRIGLVVVLALVLLGPLLHGSSRGQTQPNGTAAAGGTPPLPGQMRAALDAFAAAMEQRWSYLLPSRINLQHHVAELRDRIGPDMTPQQFALELQQLVAKGIDGHAMIVGWESALPRGFLPFLVEPAAGDRFVAFRPDRSGFVSARHPYVEQIDGKPLSDWLDAAALFVPRGSPQYVRRHALRHLRFVQFLRGRMALPEVPTVQVVLVSADGKDRTTVKLDVADRPPVYGTWPRPDGAAAVPADVVYLRLDEMDPGATRDRIEDAFRRARGARGLIIDVRDNGGGSREPLRRVARYLMKPGDAPRVVNAAVYRLHPEHDHRLMQRRFLYPQDWNGWTGAERQAIADFRKTFRPEWTPPAGLYSDWHFMVLSPDPGPDRHLNKPVVILMNEKCFSATDVFLAGLKGLPNVTFLGTPSGGGSANANTVQLLPTPIRVRLGTMVSFQSSGLMFDTHGVEPDVRVEPEPAYFVGGRDDQLDESIGIIRSAAER